MAHLVKTSTNTKDKNRWASSWELFYDAQALYGTPLSIDVCAEPETTKCNRYIIEPSRFNTLDMDQCKETDDGILYNDSTIVAVDALSVSWDADWFCNPPFDNKLPFIDHAYKQSQDNRPGVMILPYEPLTQWWQRSVDGKAAVIYEPDGRYNFYESDGVTPKKGVNFGCAIVRFDNSMQTTPRQRFKRGIGMAVGTRYFKCTSCYEEWSQIHTNHASRNGDYCPSCGQFVIPFKSEPMSN